MLYLAHEFQSGGGTRALLALVVALLGALACTGSNDDPEPLALRVDPLSIVFREPGEAGRLEAFALDADGTWSALSAAEVEFASSDPGVATVGADGVVTSIAPGGVDVVATHRGVSTYAPIIVYAPFVPVPPFDPSRVVRLGDDGPEIVVNRLIVEPAGDAYDPALARAIAADHGGNVLRDWDALGRFLLEFGIDRLDALGDILSRMEQDRRVASWHLDFMFEPAQSGPSEDPASPSFAYAAARIPEAATTLSSIQLPPVHIAVIDHFPDFSDRNGDMVVRSQAEALSDLFPNAERVYSPDWVCDHEGRRKQDPDPRIHGTHGTAVTSIISGGSSIIVGGSGPEIAGSAGAVPHYLHLYCMEGLSILDRLKGEGASISNALDHLKRADEKIAVVNISLGTTCDPEQVLRFLRRSGEGFAPHGLLVEAVEILDETVGLPGPAVDALRNVCRAWYGFDEFDDMPNTVFVIAADNTAVDVQNWYPAAYGKDKDNVMAVSGLHHEVNPPNRICGFAYGEGVTVAAEGARVHFHKPNGFVERGAGTSFSAPLVSGVAAMLRSINPDLSPAEISEILVATARDVTVDTPFRRDEDGNPRCGDAPPATWKDLDAVKAVEYVLDLESTRQVRDKLFGSAEEQQRDQAIVTPCRAWRYQQACAAVLHTVEEYWEQASTSFVVDLREFPEAFIREIYRQSRRTPGVSHGIGTVRFVGRYRHMVLWVCPPRKCRGRASVWRGNRGSQNCAYEVQCRNSGDDGHAYRPGSVAAGCGYPELFDYPTHRDHLGCEEVPSSDFVGRPL